MQHAASGGVMDIPDRIIEDVRLWRFTATVLPEVDSNIEYQWQNPLQIYAGDVLVGCGSLYLQDGQFLADCAVDYALAERLDVQTGTEVWCLPRVDVLLATLTTPHQHTKINFIRLELQKECTDGTHQPIAV
jgi:hypothetical protein